MNETDFLNRMNTALAALQTRLSVARCTMAGPLDGDAVETSIGELLSVSEALTEAADTLNQARARTLLANPGA